jgi:hypothetical protein
MLIIVRLTILNAAAATKRSEHKAADGDVARTSEVTFRYVLDTIYIIKMCALYTLIHCLVFVDVYCHCICHRSCQSGVLGCILIANNGVC